MPAKKSKADNSNNSVAIGVGLTAAAVAAAGAYFLYGSPKAKDNRRKVKSWMFKAKADVLEALEKAEDMTEAEFNQLVETVSKSYGKLKDASGADITAFKQEMYEHWPKIVKEGKQVTKTVAKVLKKKPTKSAAKKSAKKATKKAAKKTAKKAAKKAVKKTAKK